MAIVWIACRDCGALHPCNVGSITWTTRQCLACHYKELGIEVIPEPPVDVRPGSEVAQLRMD